MIDYGRALRRLGHEVEVSFWSQSPANVEKVISSVEREFTLLPHHDRSQLPLTATDFDAGYFIKSGERDGLVLPNGRSLVHAVFQNYDPHGTRYSYISRWLGNSVRDKVFSKEGRQRGLPERGREAERYGCANALSFDHLDLIVDTSPPQHGIRAELGIPEEAFVILRFGGWDTFDIEWVHEIVESELDKHPDWFFVGLNTRPFTEHSRARFIPMVMDPVEKSSIIASANVFLTARGQGEAFGVAVAEALQIGIPVLAWNGGTDQAHIDMLQGLGGLFRRPLDLRWRLRRLAKGSDPSSTSARQERGNSFRPDLVAPELLRQLAPADNM
jgi:hypothetical protein